MKIVEILGTQYNVVPDGVAGGCRQCAFITAGGQCGAVADDSIHDAVDLVEQEVGACTDNAHHYEVATCH